MFMEEVFNSKLNVTNTNTNNISNNAPGWVATVCKDFTTDVKYSSEYFM
jgi:hypothetical protein